MKQSSTSSLKEKSLKKQKEKRKIHDLVSDDSYEDNSSSIEDNTKHTRMVKIDQGDSSDEFDLLSKVPVSKKSSRTVESPVDSSPSSSSDFSFHINSPEKVQSETGSKKSDLKEKTKVDSETGKESWGFTPDLSSIHGDSSLSGNSDISECGSFLTTEDNSVVRRSRRKRMKPLEYWKNETVEMKRFDSGVGSILPIPVGVKHSPSKEKEYSRNSSAKKERREEVKQSKTEDHADESIIIETHEDHTDDAEVTEFGNVILYDRVLDDNIDKNGKYLNTYSCECQLVGHNQALTLNPLYEDNPEIKGAASLEAENLFISGVFEIPSNQQKKLENCGDNCLVAILLEGEDNKVVAQINDKEFRLKRSDVFWVPRQNEYLIRNDSLIKKAKFVFINIRSDFFHVYSSKQIFSNEQICRISFEM